MRVVGVVCENGGFEKDLKGDLVVECGGQVAPSHRLLASQSGIKLEKSTIKTDLCYMGLEIHMPNLKPQFIYYQPSPPSTIGVSFLPLDKDTYSATLIGMNKTPVPNTPQEIEEFLKPFPKGYKLFKSGTLKKIAPYKKEGSDYFHYERTGLSGFVALGDSVTSFNPLYGQGQSITAETALLLDYFLWYRCQEKGWEHNFQKLVAKKMTIPYLLAGV